MTLNIATSASLTPLYATPKPTVYDWTVLFAIVSFRVCFLPSSPPPKEIIIEGHVQNVPDGQLYLTEAHAFETPLDPTTIKAGRFRFHILPDSSFFPYMASINFPDSTRPSKRRRLLFCNYTFGADSTKHATNAFYLERGTTRMEGHSADAPYVRVFAGRETDIMYQDRFSFGGIGEVSGVQRERRLAHIHNKVKRHPYSFYLMQNIYYQKGDYSEDELIKILSLFDAPLQASKLGRMYKTYMANRNDPGQPYTNRFMRSPTGERIALLDSRSRLNMLVFWASWCGPCRMEIPLLKNLQRKYAPNGLRMVSISLDNEEGRWQKAMKEENMSWLQLIVDPGEIETIKQQFNSIGVPVTVFVNQERREVGRFLGYDPDAVQKYERLIETYLQ